MRGHAFAAGLLAAASLAISGCASEEASLSTVASPVPTESATPVPAPSPTAELDQLPLEQALDVRGEYVNHTFTSTCGGEDPVDVALADGEGEVNRSAENGSHPVYFQLDRVWRGDIGGLGTIDVAFLVCGFGASGSGVDVQVFDSDQQYVASLVPPDLYDNYLHVDSAAVEFADGGLRTGVGYWAADDCHACGPSELRVFRWTWDEIDRRLVSAEEPRGDLPISDPTDPEQRWAQVDIAVNDCGGCVITAYAVPENGEERSWASPPVEGGRTRLILPKDETQSMAFDVTRTDDPVGYFNAVAVVSLASRGEGDARQGNWCWLGATESVTTLTIRHRTVDIPEAEQPIAGDDTAHIFEADPPLPVTRDQWQFTIDGGLGSQDVPPCASELP